MAQIFGNRIYNIERSKYKLSQKGINIIKSSSYYESLSWPNPKNPKFYNLVLKIETQLNIKQLLFICKEIEKSLGRKNN